MNYTNNKEELTNFAKVAGKVCCEPKKSHEIEGENFWELKVEVERLSKIKDIIPVTISERILLDNEIKVGDFVELTGEYRSYNKLMEDKSRLILHLFAKEFSLLKEEVYKNEIKLSGYICKEPIYRKTPFDREICDVLLAINRMNCRKSDYIPVIMWGRNARFISNQKVSTQIEIVGRIQSRDYNKSMPDGQNETRTAYEVSCQNVVVKENVSKMAPNIREEKTAIVN